MLKQITIQDYAIVESLDIDLAGGMTVITGETGAGKSIVIGALVTGVMKSPHATSRSRWSGSSTTIQDQAWRFFDEPVQRRASRRRVRSPALIGSSVRMGR